MTKMTYDPEADAVYIRLSGNAIKETEESGLLVYDLDADGRIVGIEIFPASAKLAPGDWQNAPLPGTLSARAAE